MIVEGDLEDQSEECSEDRAYGIRKNLEGAHDRREQREPWVDQKQYYNAKGIPTPEIRNQIVNIRKRYGKDLCSWNPTSGSTAVRPQEGNNLTRLADRLCRKEVEEKRYAADSSLLQQLSIINFSFLRMNTRVDLRRFEGKQGNIELWGEWNVKKFMLSVTEAASYY